MVKQPIQGSAMAGTEHSDHNTPAGATAGSEQKETTTTQPHVAQAVSVSRSEDPKKPESGEQNAVGNREHASMEDETSASRETSRATAPGTEDSERSSSSWKDLLDASPWMKKNSNATSPTAEKDAAKKQPVSASAFLKGEGPTKFENPWTDASPQAAKVAAADPVRPAPERESNMPVTPSEPVSGAAGQPVPASGAASRASAVGTPSPKETPVTLDAGKQDSVADARAQAPISEGAIKPARSAEGKNHEPEDHKANKDKGGADESGETEMPPLAPGTPPSKVKRDETSTADRASSSGELTEVKADLTQRKGSLKPETTGARPAKKSVSKVADERPKAAAAAVSKKRAVAERKRAAVKSPVKAGLKKPEPAATARSITPAEAFGTPLSAEPAAARPAEHKDAAEREATAAKKSPVGPAEAFGTPLSAEPAAARPAKHKDAAEREATAAKKSPVEPAEAFGTPLSAEPAAARPAEHKDAAEREATAAKKSPVEPAEAFGTPLSAEPAAARPAEHKDAAEREATAAKKSPVEPAEAFGTPLSAQPAAARPAEHKDAAEREATAAKKSPVEPAKAANAETARKPRLEKASATVKPRKPAKVQAAPQEIPVEDLVNGVVNALGEGLGLTLGGGKVVVRGIVAGAKVGSGAVLGSGKTVVGSVGMLWRKVTGKRTSAAGTQRKS